MSCYVDALFLTAKTPRWPHKQACHLSCDTSAELLDMAAKIGLEPSWIQDAGQPSEHFDLTANYRFRAICAGAIAETGRDFARRIIRKREQRRHADHQKGDENAGGHSQARRGATA